VVRVDCDLNEVDPRELALLDYPKRPAGTGGDRSGATSARSGPTKNAALRERGVNCRARHLPPRGDLLLAIDQHVDGCRKTAQRSTEPHHLAVAGFYARLDHHEVKIASRASVSARMRAKQDHSRPWAGSLR
jgi:hypothetical protein